MAGSTDRVVAVDASWLRQGGIARMAGEILARAPAGVRVVRLRADRPNAGLLTPLDLARAARGAQAEIIWSPGFMPPLFRAPGKRLCITVHDLAHLHHYSPAHRLYYDLLIRRLLRNVDRIFTVSDHARGEIIRWSGVDPQRVVRVYNGVSEAFGGEPGAPGPGRAPSDVPRYLLYVGNRRAYKNLDRLIAAFARSGLAARGYQLWLTGALDDHIAAVAARAGVGEALRYLGDVPDAALAQLYRGAQALVFVSLYEGFGLPVVEAMASGCPVLTSNTTALAEVAGDAALLVDPCSVDGIAGGMNRICLDDPLRARLARAGLARSTRFSWDAAAARYWQTLLAD
ncbi:MAG TPA: glycosyltransferase family 1 protein [Sphingomonas sp.]|jgi:glycosyltransferase involved in cell wall biosynthesis